MPRYMLDTHMCIYLMKNQPEQVAKRFAECFVGDVVMSAITFAELADGVAVSANRASVRNLAALVEEHPDCAVRQRGGRVPTARSRSHARAQEGPARQADRGPRGLARRRARHQQ